MATLIDKETTLAVFQRFIDEAQARLDQAIDDGDWQEATTQGIWISGLNQGYVIVNLAKPAMPQPP